MKRIINDTNLQYRVVGMVKGNTNSTFTFHPSRPLRLYTSTSKPLRSYSGPLINFS